MGLIDELRKRKAEILSELKSIDIEAAGARDQWERTMASLRQKRQKLDETLGTIDALIKTEGGE
jgi:hypothetical protein